MSEAYEADLLVDQFPRLLREHQDMVYSIAMRVAGDRGASEEIAQDVFPELHGKLNGLESEDHVKYWLRRVASHRADRQPAKTDGQQRA